MLPFIISSIQPFCRWFGFSRITIQPVMNIVMIVLLAPQHPGKGLALYHFMISILCVLLKRVVKFICFILPGFKYPIKVVKGLLSILGQPQAKGDTLLCRHLYIIVYRRLGTGLFWVDGIRTMYQMVVNAIFTKHL